MTGSFRARGLFLASLLCWGALASSAGAGEPLSADSRKGATEVSIGVGVFPVPLLFELTTDIALAGLSLGTLEPSTESKGTPLYLECSRFVGENTRFTGNFNFARFEKEYEIAGTGETAGAVTDDFYSILVGINYHYLRLNGLELYLGILAGGAVLRSSATIDEVEVENEFLPAHQLNALGVRAGGRNALDLSIGIGYKGLLTAGLVHRF